MQCSCKTALFAAAIIDASLLACGVIMLIFGPQKGQCSLPSHFSCEGNAVSESWQVEFKNVSFVSDQGVQASCAFAPSSGNSEAECEQKGALLVSKGSHECILPARMPFDSHGETRDLVCTVGSTGEHNAAAAALTVFSVGALVLICFCAEAKDDERPRFVCAAPRRHLSRPATKLTARSSTKTAGSPSTKLDIECGPPVVTFATTTVATGTTIKSEGQPGSTAKPGKPQAASKIVTKSSPQAAYSQIKSAGKSGGKSASASAFAWKSSAKSLTKADSLAHSNFNSNLNSNSAPKPSGQSVVGQK